ncbi:hypothetical protein [Polyangium jinanense]|uniref:Uncharacterized protein n=1 Tax=Polyangium jinanense TaxID=2829994 RepID=A0A9X4AU34_9BACT|nr:hypothetical protein [Polyangium jinanense]MDC3956766.1 hypothetical protein [Polyangium jinanense]MDC3984829.1 hypothetical protein [Polyangium jinanense]
MGRGISRFGWLSFVFMAGCAGSGDVVRQGALPTMGFEAEADPAPVDAESTPPALAPAPPAQKVPPAPKDPPSFRAPTVPYSLGVLGLGAAFIVAGGVMMGVAETADERCGVAGCYGVLDPNLDFAGRLFLANGIGIGIASVTATLVGLGTDGTPTPRKSDAFTERGIFATALGVGLACTGLAAARGDDFQLEGLPSAVATGAYLGALAVTGLGLGFWIYGARNAQAPAAASLRVGPTSAQFTVRY